MYIIALMATRDIVSDFNLVRASISNIANDPKPQRRRKFFITAGIIFCMIAIFEYRQLRNHESMYLLQHLFNNWFRELSLDKMSAAAVVIALLILVLILGLQRSWDRED